MVTAKKIYSACLIIIGNEILSGRTQDKTLSAQYEHTIYINGDNIEILTESPNKVFYN